MKLKDAIRQEACTVFLSEDDFADAIVIDGVETVGIWDDSEAALAGQSLGGVPDVDSFGLGADQRVLHVPSDAIPAPVNGQRLCIDGAYWIATTCGVDSLGLMQLKLTRVHA